ncbi:Fosmidomycin resistance protein [Paenibacillus sp. BIHB 4019]|uniref:Fosmidomycin resistance protein n=1 Tax=Paenibacillus sp. BIHB 4019 TaxID=1870819 RepID=A0A1B2DIL6_9BACL|nr:MFS transporter [Paenibacillus sp. BIHB 4019]ANY67543.1 Fosmidomycin resistance protein [Paenibacillus sp. BIHB 4019]
MSTNQAAIRPANVAATTFFPILFAASSVHLLNDTIQSIVPALYPVLKDSFSLTFSQIGFISLIINLTAAILQPLIGIFTDKRPIPRLLPIGILFTLAGVLVLSFSAYYWMILAAVMLIGIGSAIFHPESARVAYVAGGARKGLAQSIFQFGGNIGQALAPIMTAMLFVHTGQKGVVWFSLLLVVGFMLQSYVARWYTKHLKAEKERKGTVQNHPFARSGLSKARVAVAVTIIMILVFSKYVYISAITSYYSFYAIEKFGVSTSQAQLILFVFLVANVIGLLFGGMLADKFSRRALIWFSILGTAPFSLALPYANLTLSVILIFFAGLILASAFSIIMVYTNELLPGKVGLVSGIFFGLAFGLGGAGSAILGNLADATSIVFVIQCCSYLPLLGLFTVFLPSDKKNKPLQAA